MSGMSHTLCTTLLVVGVLGAGAVSAASVKATPLGQLLVWLQLSWPTPAQKLNDRCIRK